MKSARYLLALGVAVALFAPPAFAQAKKDAKDKKGAPAAGASATAKKDDPKKADAKKKERTGPAAMAKNVPKLDDLEREKIADQKRDEQIESAKKIIPKLGDGTPQKAEMLFQLSELYWEKSKYLYAKEMLSFQENEKKTDEARNKGEKVADAKEDHRESELYRSETMRLYETILREYPEYERRDEVLFDLAYNQYEIGKKDAAIKRYQELIKNYPGSKFVPDTYVQLGNHYFDVANDLVKAKEMYEKALNSPQPKIKNYALYKLAWCDVNAGEHEKALKKFEDVVDASERLGKEGTDLKNEALNDSVGRFVQLNRADDAVAYYKQHAGKKKMTRLIVALANGLEEAGHYDNAIKIFRGLLAEAPTAESAPDFQHAIIKAYEGLRQRDQVKSETKKMAELYRPGSSWWAANTSKPEVLRNGFNVAEEAMRTIVTDYHTEAQKTKSIDTYRLARDIYKQYIDAFASGDDENYVSDQAFNLRFYYAEILWALEEWENAAHQYDAVASFKIPNRPEARDAASEKFRQMSSYNAILAWTKLVNIERGVAVKSDLKEGSKIDENKKKEAIAKSGKVQKRSVKELEEKALTKYEQSLVNACDVYNTKYPKNADEIEIAYGSAAVYYDKNHFLEAAKRFGDIINKYPEDKRAIDAADLTMSVLEEKEEWLELNKQSRSFLANKKLAKPNTDFTKRTAAIVEGSQYKYVSEVVFKKEKNPAAAAEGFLKFVAEFPKSDNADKALTFAHDIFYDSGQYDKTIEVAERELKEYPNTIYDLRLKYSLAYLYEKTAQFERSAAMYEDFIDTYDQAAGAKAVNWDNIKDLLKKEKEQKDKEAKAAAKGKKPEAPKPAAKAAPVDAKVAEQRAKDREAELKLAANGPDIGGKPAPAGQRIADSTFNAALWWEGTGHSDKALVAWGHYIARFKDRDDVPKIAYNLALIYEKEKKTKEALAAYEGFLKTYEKDKRVTDLLRLEAKYKILQDDLRQKDTAGAERMVKDITAAYPKLSDADRKNDRAMAAYAQCRFMMLEPMWAQYLAIKFNKVATLKQDLAAKLKKEQEVEKAYTEVLQIGSGEYGIAALTRIGMAYGDFAQNFLDSPTPKGLDEDQTEMYRAAIEEKAFPLEEKALEGLEKALAKAYELNIYNEWTTLAQDKINKYHPGQYAKAHEAGVKGSEFFVTADVEKKATIPEAAPKAPQETPKTQEAGTKQQPTSAAVTPGAGEP